jgi:predicted kinase
MEAVLFIGLPASGKSSFYKQRYFGTHVRISLDLLRTRYREKRLLEICLETQQPFVVDNTNCSRSDRAAYIAMARERRFTIVGYYFRSTVTECLARNAQRQGDERVPDVAILSAAKRRELPAANEGYDRLFYVRMEASKFVVEDWNDDL